MWSFGSFVGETNGYAVYEGTELEVMNTIQQYVPFVTYKMHPVATEYHKEYFQIGLLRLRVDQYLNSKEGLNGRSPLFLTHFVF